MANLVRPPRGPVERTCHECGQPVTVARFVAQRIDRERGERAS